MMRFWLRVNGMDKNYLAEFLDMLVIQCLHFNKSNYEPYSKSTPPPSTLTKVRTFFEKIILRGYGTDTRQVLR